MSRLFYDDSDAADSSRPRFQVKIRQQKQDASRYLEKVAKLVPSEIIAGYVGLVGLVPLVHNREARPWIYLVVFVLCIVLTPLYLRFQANTHKPYKIHVLVSTIAFVVWAYSISGAAIVPGLYDPAIASMLLIAFTLISGTIPLRR
jgi:hypothetical protein